MTEEQQREQGVTPTTVPMTREMTQLLTEIRRRDAGPFGDPVLADAEEEEMAQLWAADPGNQGA